MSDVAIIIAGQTAALRGAGVGVAVHVVHGAQVESGLQFFSLCVNMSQVQQNVNSREGLQMLRVRFATRARGCLLGC